MLDKEKVRLMTKLAFYERTQGKEDFITDEYYRKDYVGFHMICSILWTTIGYACVVGITLLAGMDWILANISKSLIITIGAAIVAGYFVTVVIYALISKKLFDRKHKGARQRVKIFNHNLDILLRTYEKEKR